jgi:ATP-dependent exoDNAse (exonuclease V) beta subunit
LHEFQKRHPQIHPETHVDSIRTDLLTVFNRLWHHAHSQLNALNMEKANLEDFRQQSETMLLNYSNWLLTHSFKCPDFSELRLYSNTLGLMGIIDAVFQDPGRAVIIDYKTSQQAVLTDHIKRQAMIYALLYQERYQEMPDAVWIHFLIEPGEPVPIYIDEHLLDYAKLFVESMHEKTMLRDELDYPCTCGGYCEQGLVK